MTDDEKKEHKLRTDRWIENNKERYAEHKKQYQIDNREWISERSKKHRKENPSIIKNLERYSMKNIKRNLLKVKGKLEMIVELFLGTDSEVSV